VAHERDERTDSVQFALVISCVEADDVHTLAFLSLLFNYYFMKCMKFTGKFHSFCTAQSLNVGF
jgi:hypothetical protein